MLFLRPTGSSLEQGHRFHAVVTAKPVVWLVTARLYPLLVAVLAVSFIVLSNLAASDVPSWLAVVWLASAVCIVVCELTRFDRQVLRALLGSFEVLYLLANMLLFVAFKAWSQLDDVPLAVKCLRSAAVLWLPLLVLFDAAPSYPMWLRRGALLAAIANIVVNTLRESGAIGGGSPQLVAHSFCLSNYCSDSRALFVTTGVNVGVFVLKCCAHAFVSRPGHCQMLRAQVALTVVPDGQAAAGNGIGSGSGVGGGVDAGGAHTQGRGDGVHVPLIGAAPVL